jgi:putative ABC transport system substrate-binding protein
LQLFKQTLPTVSRLALISNPDQPGYMDKNRENYTADGRALGIKVEQFPARNLTELEVAFEKIKQSGFEGVLIGRAGLFDTSLKHDIAKLALSGRLPTIGDTGLYPDAGVLMSYSALWSQTYALAAACVKRILAGEKPADIPVQQPTKFDFVINLKTARALNIEISPQVLALADRVIE